MPMNNTIHFNNTKIGLVNRYLSDIFSDIDGYATGDLTFEGEPGSLNLIGEVALKNAALTVNYTQVRYAIDTAFFRFNKDNIDFGKFTLRDRYNNKATVEGTLYENAFKNMRYDFDMYTDKLLLLDTKGKDNQQFYGRAIGKATVSLKGPQENMHMSVIGEVNDTTHIYIPSTATRENSEADFIVFKKYGTEIEKAESKSDSKFNIDLDLTANNNAQIDLILDPLTGDVITATGNGRMRINVPAKGNMTMNGRYNIESGNYNFNFQSFIRKPFELKKDAGSYIEWNGDPYKAQMHVIAQYTAEHVSTSDLLSNINFQNQSAAIGYRGDVYVLASLDGPLMNPAIKFSFDFPPGTSIANDHDFKLFLNKVESDDNEMLKQVTWLIVFGTFAPYGELGSGGNIARSTGINTISSKITGELNRVIGNLLTKITGDKSLQFDVSTSTYSSSSLYNANTSTSQSNQLDRTVVNVKVNQSLLNDKVIITLGTGVDFNVGSSAVQNNNLQWLPDISVQFVLSRDRKLRAIVFNKSSLDVTNANGYLGRRTRQGISISYTFDFPKEEKPPINTDSTTASFDAPSDSRKSAKGAAERR
jgi:hypothetical protein